MTGGHDQPRGQARPRGLVARPPQTARPADVIRDLMTLLRAHGLTRLYWSSCATFAVVSVTYGLTAWTDGHTLTWRHDGVLSTWTAADTDGAATQLARLARPQPPQP